MEALGRLFDIVPISTPVDWNTANGFTGNRVHLQNAGGITFVVFKAAGTNGEDPDFDVRQHTAASGGTSADLDVVVRWYKKEETTLDGDETWTKTTQSAASEVDTGTDAAEVEGLYVIEVEATSLSDGYEWVSLDCTVTASNAQLGCCLGILRDLAVQRAPANLRNPQL